jgi:uncharacterized protein YjbI with pentapeptide repeats
LLWASEWRLDGSRSNLGAALLGGAVVAATVLFVEIVLNDQTRHDDLRFTIALQRDLTGADLRDRDLSQLHLYGKILSSADLSGEDLSYTVLKSADLRKAMLDGADLTGTDLTGARLQGALLFGTDLRQTELRDVYLSGAKADSSTQWPLGFDPKSAGVQVES